MAVSGHFGIRRLNIVQNLYQIFLTDLPREQKVSIPLHQNVSILFVNNKYIGNILTTMMAVIVMEVKARSLYQEEKNSRVCIYIKN